MARGRRSIVTVDRDLPRTQSGHSDRRFSPTSWVRRPRRTVRVVRRVSRRA